MIALQKKLVGILWNSEKGSRNYRIKRSNERKTKNEDIARQRLWRERVGQMLSKKTWNFWNPKHSLKIATYISFFFHLCFRGDNGLAAENLAHYLDDSCCVNTITLSDIHEVILKGQDNNNNNNVENTHAAAISTYSQTADKASTDDSEETAFSSSGTILISMLKEDLYMIVYWDKNNRYIGVTYKVKPSGEILVPHFKRANRYDQIGNAVIWQLCPQTKF